MAYVANFKAVVISTLFAFCTSAVNADEVSESNNSKKSIPEATKFVTQHKGTFNGKKLKYKAVAGETYLLNKNEEPTAAIFSFDYLAADDNKNRPVTFIWNGGPGSSSNWLHMGAYGPKRVVVPSDATAPGLAPYELKDAPETILDVTDMVFVDPVGTGYSRALGDTESKAFWGLKEDASSIADFIAQWLTKENRWNAPVFLLGESYGTTRAAAVSKVLMDKHLINVNGIIFVSQALDYQGSSPYVDDNIISYITYIPTLAATAWYHKKVDTSGNFEAFIDASRKFAVDELLPALFKGNALSKADRTRIVDGLHRYTGLSKQYIEQVDLRINAFRFAKELLRDEGVAVGLLDGRYKLDERDDLTAAPKQDASKVIGPAYKAALMKYMRTDLNVQWKRKYLNPGDPELSDNWRWRTAPDGQGWEPRYVNTAPDLSYVLRSNPQMKVMVASGYYDIVTPFFDAEYTLNRHGIYADKIDYHYYHGGHMMYVHEPARVSLLNDTREFIKKQVSQNQR
ncbi:MULTISPECIES: serine carboxypeptidase [unclassified Pseudoalteromonas]|uniref:S10 family peptidase n=1 Tax=unclassified Pseudoalteromonas TaxID=194690 RepID=UPI001107FC36|nr:MULTISPECIES: serine carboxypeptidase [unclassified Pseudoalteromonas]TMO41750.1 serine carboxypeptidase [Pseudoalteromonas sp. S4389]